MAKPKKQRPPRIALQIDDHLYERLMYVHEEFRRVDRFANFSDTVRELIEAGLDRHAERGAR